MLYGITTDNVVIMSGKNKSVKFGKVETIFEPIIEGEAEIFGLGC